MTDSSGHRNYQAAGRRYLQPEPLLSVVSTPQSVEWMNYAGRHGGDPPRGGPRELAERAKQGMSMPTYSYAQNNPLRFFDPDGLGHWSVLCDDGHVKSFSSGFSDACVDCALADTIANSTPNDPCAKKMADHICKIAEREGGGGKGCKGKAQSCNETGGGNPTGAGP